jgi:uncharacterized paraquat-inducible protein A
MVGKDSYCCPRCGIIFRRYRLKQVVLWLTAISIAGYLLASHANMFHHLPRVFH